MGMREIRMNFFKWLCDSFGTGGGCPELYSEPTEEEIIVACVGRSLATELLDWEYSCGQYFNHKRNLRFYRESGFIGALAADRYFINGLEISPREGRKLIEIINDQKEEEEKRKKKKLAEDLVNELKKGFQIG